MQKSAPARTVVVNYFPLIARAIVRVLALPVFVVMAVGAMLLILTRLYRT
jgi:hypothetical protein